MWRLRRTQQTSRHAGRVRLRLQGWRQRRRRARCVCVCDFVVAVCWVGAVAVLCGGASATQIVCQLQPRLHLWMLGGCVTHSPFSGSASLTPECTMQRSTQTPPPTQNPNTTINTNTITNNRPCSVVCRGLCPSISCRPPRPPQSSQQ